MKLRVWHIPQVPMTPFYVEVDDWQEAVRIICILWDYDAFEYDNNIKHDYTNATGLEEYDPDTKEWTEWHHPELDMDIQECIDAELRGEV